jgi:hypothetical protein
VNSHDKSSAYQLHCGLFRLVCTNGMVVSDGTFQRISIKHSGFNPDSVIEASFKVLNAVPDIMNKVQLFQDRILTDAEQLALATGAAAYRREDLTKAPVSPSRLLNPRRYGDGAKDLVITLNCVQENIIGANDRTAGHLMHSLIHLNYRIPLEGIKKPLRRKSTNKRLVPMPRKLNKHLLNPVSVLFIWQSLFKKSGSLAYAIARIGK